MDRDPNPPRPSSPGHDFADRSRETTAVFALLTAGRFIVATLGHGWGGIGWGIWWRFYVRTNNAYVVGNITPVSSEISGMVVALYADDNMIVKAGDPIAQIDPVQWQLAVDQAVADLKQLQAQERASDVGVQFIRRDRTAFLEGTKARAGRGGPRRAGGRCRGPNPGAHP